MSQDSTEGSGEQRELSICEQLTRPAEEFVNDSQIEAAWSSVVIRHMEAYYKLIRTIDDHTTIRLSNNDDQLYDALKAKFPDLNTELLTESDLKSERGEFVYDLAVVFSLLICLFVD